MCGFLLDTSLDAMVFGLKFLSFSSQHHIHLHGKCFSLEANQSLLRIPKGYIAVPSFKQKEIHISTFHIVRCVQVISCFCFHLISSQMDFFLKKFELEWGWIWVMLCRRQERKAREARKRNENNVRKGAFLLPWHSIVQYFLISWLFCAFFAETKRERLNNRLCENGKHYRDLSRCECGAWSSHPHTRSHSRIVFQTRRALCY